MVGAILEKSGSVNHLSPLSFLSFQRLDELDRFSKLFSTFVRSYQNVLVDNIETFQNVSQLLIRFMS